MSIDILLADDHVMVRDGLKAVLESEGGDIQVVGEADNGEEVLKLAKNIKFDVYILDISMPVLNGIDTAEKLMKMDPKSKIIMLSMYDKKAFVDRSLKIGVKGYLVKESASDELVRAIKDVYSGRIYLSPRISEIVLNGHSSYGAPGKKLDKKKRLTSRETEILQLVAKGFSVKEIAAKLDIAVNTVIVHKRSMMRKLGIHKQMHLVRYALEEGIVDL